MVSLNDIQSQRERILEIARRHGASRVRIFGSVSRGLETSTSDIDLLVCMAPDRSLLDRIAWIPTRLIVCNPPHLSVGGM